MTRKSSLLTLLGPGALLAAFAPPASGAQPPESEPATAEEQVLQIIQPTPPPTVELLDEPLRDPDGRIVLRQPPGPGGPTAAAETSELDRPPGGGPQDEPGDGDPELPILDPLSAQVSFQAVLTDNLGNPLPGPTVRLSFQLYTAPGGAAIGGAIVIAGVPITPEGVVDVGVPLPPANFDGSGRALGVRVDSGAGFGPELAPRIVLRAAVHAYRVHRVASAELDDQITLGDPATLGVLDVQSGFGSTGATVDGDGLFGGGGQIDLFDETGARALLAGASSAAGGFVEIYDDSGTIRTINLDGDANGATAGGGGLLTVYQSDGSAGVSIDGDETDADGGGNVSVLDDTGLTRVQIDGDALAIDDNLTETDSGAIFLFDSAGTRTIALGAQDSFNTGGELQMFNSAGGQVFDIDTGTTGGAFIAIRDGSGTSNNGLTISTSTASGTTLTGIAADGTGTFLIDSDSSGGGLMTLDQNDGSTGVTLDGDAGTDAGGSISVHDSVSAIRVQLVGESVGTGGELSLFDDDGTETIEILAAESASEGGSMKFFLADGTGPTIEIDGHFVSGAQPDGRVITDELQITGGADLSEQFDVRPHAAGAAVEPGMVVCIDPERPGELIVSSRAYDSTVAGIISGAGGVDAGIYMGQRDTEFVDGNYPVALTGRVYVMCDARSRPIVPGNLLTTAPLPGHAMRATDHTRTQGAVIGKAMTGLETGRGLVLVLVSLQ